MTEEKLWKKLDELHEDVIKLRIAVAMLNVKSGVWGFAAGLIPAIGIILFGIAK